MNKIECSKNHRYLSMFKYFEYGQDDRTHGRHVCAGCAYEAGVKDAINGKNSGFTPLSSLPHSQAGSVRHKNSQRAYEKGYKFGKDITS